MDEGQAAELVVDMLQAALDLGFVSADDSTGEDVMRDIAALDIGEVCFTAADGQRFRMTLERIEE